MNTNYQQQLRQAHAMLQQNRPTDCISVCKRLLSRMPGELNAQHLLALALQRAGQPQEAERSFLKALKAAPKNPELLVGLAKVLRSLGRLSEAEHRLRKALKVAPDSAAAAYTLALTLFSGARFDEAERYVMPLLGPSQRNPAVWELAAAIAQKHGELAVAISRCREGITAIPNAPRLHYSLAQLLRQECEFEAAAAAYADALRLGYAEPELYRNRSEALLDAGDLPAANACIAEGVDRYPGHAPLHRTAARLSFSSAQPGDPLAKLARASHAQPGNAALWQTLVELLKRLDREDEASDKLQEARRLGCPDTPEILALEALDAAHRGNEQECVRRFEDLMLRFGQHRYVVHNFAMQLLINDDAQRAGQLCEEALRRDPFDQMMLAYQGTAWQLLGDKREQWLLDYDRMIVPVAVPVPEGFTDRAAFFSAIGDVLEDLHHSNAQPIEQSVRGGTQTNGFLFRLKHPLLAILEHQIREAIVTALRSFPAEVEHPFWSRCHPDLGHSPAGALASESLRFSGAWSVRLRDQGYHANHIHTEGWISSALYISLPDEVQLGAGTEGHIQFGTPMTELGLDLAPRRIVKPDVGTLVLFPSYMWHGTLPFHSDQSRTTVAFDLLPGV
ncbi:MAG: tetratricopeptide repeat protein [Congregibacter sp.]